jgi:hypothetical protein
VQRGEQHVTLQGWVRDLSESGLRAFVADSLLPGEDVTFEIPLSQTGSQVIPAKVMRALGTDYGFQFTALSSEQRNRIQSVLSQSPELNDTHDGSSLALAAWMQFNDSDQHGVESNCGMGV